MFSQTFSFFIEKNGVCEIDIKEKNLSMHVKVREQFLREIVCIITALSLYFSNFCFSYWNAASHYYVCLHLGKFSIWL